MQYKHSKLKILKYFILLILVLAAIFESEAVQENRSNVKITNITINDIEVPIEEYSDIVIGDADSIKFNYKLEELAGSVKSAYIFKLIFKNSAGDSAIKTSGSANCMYSKLNEDNYDLTISAFDVDGKWVTAPEIIMFRVNNKEARLISANKNLLAEKKIADSTISALKSNKLNNFGFGIDSANINIIMMVSAAIIVILLILVIFLLIKISKTKKHCAGLAGKLESKDSIAIENKKLRMQIESDTAEMLELKKTIDNISKKMANMIAVNSELTSNIALVSSKANELETLQETKNTVFSDILARGIVDPTASIKSLVDLLRSYDFNATDTKDIVDNIVEATQKIIFMSEDIQRLVEFERKEKVEARCETISISKLIEEAISNNKSDASQRKINIETHIASDVKEFYLDYDKIVVVLHNLINNAIKYTYGGGNVIISCFNNNSKIPSLTFEVKDDGIGISEKDLKYFSDSSLEISKHHEKIGFLTVKKYVEAHNGKLNVSSVIGKGSTFSFTIPDLRNF